MERGNAMKNLIAMAGLALVLAAGCNKQNTSSTASSSPNGGSSVSTESSASLTPEQLGELGAKMKAHPNDAQKLLADAGLSEASFESQIRKVSSDPAASKRYAAAYKHAS